MGHTAPTAPPHVPARAWVVTLAGTAVNPCLGILYPWSGWEARPARAGGAAIYIAPLARFLIADYGLSGSFIVLGLFFAFVVIVAGQLLSWPPPGYVPPPPPEHARAAARATALAGADWPARDMVHTPQY